MLSGGSYRGESASEHYASASREREAFTSAPANLNQEEIKRRAEEAEAAKLKAEQAVSNQIPTSRQDIFSEKARARYGISGRNFDEITVRSGNVQITSSRLGEIRGTPGFVGRTEFLPGVTKALEERRKENLEYPYGKENMKLSLPELQRKQLPKKPGFLQAKELALESALGTYEDIGANLKQKARIGTITPQERWLNVGIVGAYIATGIVKGASNLVFHPVASAEQLLEMGFDYSIFGIVTGRAEKRTKEFIEQAITNPLRFGSELLGQSLIFEVGKVSPVKSVMSQFKISKTTKEANILIKTPFEKSRAVKYTTPSGKTKINIGLVGKDFEEYNLGDFNNRELIIRKAMEAKTESNFLAKQQLLLEIKKGDIESIPRASIRKEIRKQIVAKNSIAPMSSEPVGIFGKELPLNSQNWKPYFERALTAKEEAKNIRRGQGRSEPVGIFGKELPLYNPESLYRQKAKEEYAALIRFEAMTGQRGLDTIPSQVRKSIRKELRNRAYTSEKILGKPYQDVIAPKKSNTRRVESFEWLRRKTNEQLSKKIEPSIILDYESGGSLLLEKPKVKAKTKESPKIIKIIAAKEEEPKIQNTSSTYAYIVAELKKEVPAEMPNLRMLGGFKPLYLKPVVFTRHRIKQEKAQSQRQEARARQITQQVQWFGQSQRQEARARQITQQVQWFGQSQRQEARARQGQSKKFFPELGPPELEPPELEPPFLSSTKKEGSSKETTKKEQLVNFNPKYFSSIEAEIFGIKGKHPKRLITGLEIRPL